MKTGRVLLMGVMLMLPGVSFAGHAPMRADIQEAQAALFAQADADGNGTLSLDEFKTFESLLREKMADRHFQRLDADSDGGVSLEELQAGHHRRGRGGPPPWLR